MGRLKKQVITEMQVFGFTTINTKFGSCCVKVWLAFKKNEK
jgi:hypothetical protein